jgi:hypothetical protein
MTVFLYRCPSTGQQVQGWTDDFKRGAISGEPLSKGDPAGLPKGDQQM